MRHRFAPGPTNFNASFGLTWRHYWKLRSNPIDFATRLSREYGDVAFFRVFWHRIFLVNHPDLIRQVLVTEAENFPKFDRVRDHLRQATGNGLLVTQGNVWRKQRLDTQKIFRSNRMAFFAKLAKYHTSAMLSRWKGQSEVQIEHEMTLLTQAIMGEAFFGIQLESGHQIAEAVRLLSDAFHHESRALFNLPDSFPSRSKKRKSGAIKLLRDALTGVVKCRLGSGERRDDFLDMLIHASAAPSDERPSRRSSHNSSSVDGIVSQLLTMYVAGFHTTSVALAWLMFAVARHQNIQRRVREEVHQVCPHTPPERQHLDELKYSQMVVKESLRMYPAAWELFARSSVRDSVLNGYEVPANSLVLILPAVTHRDPRFFPEPETFDPLRFSPSREREISPYAWIPFGAGPHHCIGKSLAMMQMCQILATVIQQFELRLDENTPRRIRVVAKVSLRPSADITLSLDALEDLFLTT